VKPYSVYFDIDGTLTDSFNLAAYNYSKDYFKLTESYEEFWQKTWWEYPDLYHENLVNTEILYSMFSPRKDIVNAVKDISKQYQVGYISVRPLEFEHLTLKYLYDYEFPNWNNLVLTKDKEIEIRKICPTFFVEDRTNTVEQIKNLTNVFYVRQPWNYGKEVDGVTSINGVWELPKYLLWNL
jgi:uncharacterized HAD superfamily protein